MNRRYVYGGSCGALIVVILGLTLINSSGRDAHANQTSPPEQSPEPLEELTPHEERLLMLRIGLTPEALVVGGCEPEDIGLVRSTLTSDLERVRDFLELEEQLVGYTKSLDDVRSEIRRFGLTESLAELRTTLSTNRGAAIATRAELQRELLEAVASAVTLSIGSENARMLRNYSANGQRKVRESYRVLSLTEAEWAALERAEANQDRDGSNPLTEEEASVAGLAAASADVATAAARIVDLATLAEIESALSNSEPD